ncbi:hypothetical protein CPB83DRAFT_841312, partial [Crepidotus variabilis]
MMLEEREKELEESEKELAEARKLARKQQGDFEKLKAQRENDAMQFKEMQDSFRDFRKSMDESLKSCHEAEENLQRVQVEHAKEKAKLADEVAALHRRIGTIAPAEDNIQESGRMSVDVAIDSFPSRCLNYTPSPSAHRDSQSPFNPVPSSSGHTTPERLGSPFRTTSQQTTPGPLFATRGAFSLRGGVQTPRSSIGRGSITPRGAYNKPSSNEIPMDLSPSTRQSRPLPAHHHSSMAASSSGQHHDSRGQLPMSPSESKGSSVLNPIPPSRLKAYSKSKHNLPSPPANLQAGRPPLIPTVNNFEGLQVNDKLNALFAMLQHGGIGVTTPAKRRPGPKSDFKDPIRKEPRTEERNQELTEEIMNFSHELYATDSELHRQMAAYEETREQRYAPKLRPMKINFDNMAGAWNLELYLQFKAFALDDGYGGGELTNPEE